MERIGFIGAGKVGTSLGKYLKLNGLNICGFYDRLDELSLYASKETGSEHFVEMSSLVEASDVVFVTVNDDAIPAVWETLRHLHICGKFVFHCSGVLSSEIFDGSIGSCVYAGSVHPVCAVRSPDSADVFFGKFFVLEGNEKGLEKLKTLMNKTGNPFRIVGKADKAKYHAAAVASSNLFCALAQMGEDWLSECGFDSEAAHKILVPLMQGNVENMASKGCVAALTGPVERGDVGTIKRHLDVLEANDREVYRLLSLRLLDMAEKKNPDKDFNKLKEVLQNDKKFSFDIS